MKWLSKKAYFFIILLIPFCLDLLVPLGVAMANVYVLGQLLLIRQSRRTIMYYSLFACILSLISLFLQHFDSFTWEVISNRLLSIGSITVVGVILLRYGVKEEKIKLESELESKKKLINELKHHIDNQIFFPLIEVNEKLIGSDLKHLDHPSLQKSSEILEEVKNSIQSITKQLENNQ